MIVEERRVTIREVTENYFNDNEEGVTGYDDRLDIRPRYQREFVYKDEQRDEVIRSIMRGLPLNVIYWAKTGEDTYEILDGQQRTISFCEYVDGSFSVDGRYFGNLPKDIRDEILNYELFVYVCDGTDSEKLEWFKIINIAGEELTNQELRNAVYAGPWITDAKRYFSKTNCAAYVLASDYMTGSPIRQDYLETVLSWVTDREGTTIEDYMGRHQHEQSAQALWVYFRTVIEWVSAVFPNTTSQMKGLPWGIYYNEHGERTDLDPVELEERARQLLGDYDVTRKRGVYEYLLTGDERVLNIRQFDERDRLAAYERQGHKCVYCQEEFDIREMHADHTTPWSKGGKTVEENCQMLCRDCNLKKSNH